MDSLPFTREHKWTHLSTRVQGYTNHKKYKNQKSILLTITKFQDTELLGFYHSLARKAHGFFLWQKDSKKIGSYIMAFQGCCVSEAPV